MCIIHHLQECDHRHHESRIHPPGLLMIYSLHLPQAMRGTTLNEQHKPHSLMSNFSIAYFLEIRIWWFMICLAGGLITPVLPDPMSPITRWHWMTTWHDYKQFTRTILRAGHEISENQFLICCLLVTPILLSAKTKVNEIKTSFFYQTPDFRKSLIELILVCIYRIPSLRQAHFIPCVRVPDMIMIVMTWHPSHGGQWQSWHHGMQWHEWVIGGSRSWPVMATSDHPHPQLHIIDDPQTPMPVFYPE